MSDNLDSTISVTTDNADSYTIDYNSTLMASSVSTGPIVYTTPGFNGSSLNYQIGNYRCSFFLMFQKKKGTTKTVN